jgi:hypothetical protein
MKSRGRIIALAVIVLAWFALAIFSALQGASWFVPVCYAACGIVMALILYRTVAPVRQRQVRSSDTGVSASARARRSGNPSVRAQAHGESDTRS